MSERETASESIMLRLTPGELAGIDRARGPVARSTWLKGLAADGVAAAEALRGGPLGSERASGAAVSNAPAPAEVPVVDEARLRRDGLLAMGVDPVRVAEAVERPSTSWAELQAGRPIVQKRAKKR